MKIALGICGSIAAYRSVDFVKELKAKGHEVQCLLTKNAHEFVSPKVLESFSHNKILSYDVFSSDHQGTDHIQGARWADCLIVYGATANFLARAAAGLADDFLTLQLIAFKGPVLMAPAMNPSMWEHPATVENMKKLRSWGYHFAGPVSGVVACGEHGVGHLATHEQILESLNQILPYSKLRAIEGKNILISAGPMRTHVDSVRYLQNRSSGKMGLELARALKNAGATRVQILLGPVEKSILQSFLNEFEIFHYQSATDYEEKLQALFPQCDIFFSAAAVLDFELEVQNKKLNRSDLSQLTQLPNSLVPVPDLVAKVASQKKPGQIVIAFAAESGSEEEIIQRASSKMLQKKVDALIANPVWDSLGPEADNNQVWILSPSQKPIKLGPMLKTDLARPIIEKLFESIA